MWKYVVKRLLLVIPVNLLIILIVFYILNITPGDPATIILGYNAPPEEIAQLNEELGVNDPFLVQYVHYIQDICHLDFGESYRTGLPVFDELMPKFPTTLVLAVLCSIVLVVIGIPLGILSAVKEYSALDITLTVSSLLLASMPGFWLGLLLILFFSLWLGILPSGGVQGLSSFILPVLSVALPAAALQARFTRTQMLEVMRQDYIRTARAKGADQSRVIWKHALKNTLLPAITMLGMSFAALLGGSMITEAVFGLPGIGNAILTAVQMKDTPLIMASTIFLSTLYMLIMLAVDIINAYIDPQVRAVFAK